MTETSERRRASVARLAALLMVIGLGACDNVDWGGIELAFVRPPPRAAEVEGGLEVADRLPQNPLLYYVRRDSLNAEVVPVGEITEEGVRTIPISGDPESYGTRFIAAFLRQGAELTVFHHGRRAGTVILESATVPSSGVCRRLPRGIGELELSSAAADATEFIAMARTQAPDGLMIPGGTLEADRRMRVLGPMIAERALRARNAQLPNWSVALRQLQPFPLSEASDLGFTATFLVDDELQVGNDDLGYSLFIVALPEAQTGYDTAYVDYRSYPNEGKAAPRVVDFLDWDRDGSPELLLEVYGTTNRWFETIGRVDDEWRRTLREECDPGATVAVDTATADTAAPARGTTGTQRAPATTTPQAPPTAAPDPGTAQDTAPPPTEAQVIPDILPEIRLLPSTGTRSRRPPPDTSGAQT